MIMKKYIFIALLLIVPFMSHADGGFLNVHVNVYNQNGGTLKPKNMTWKVSYDGHEDFITGSIQGYEFPYHTSVSEPLTYSVTPVIDTVGVQSQYSAKLEEKTRLGCSDTLDAKRMTLVDCTIYFFDDQTFVPAPALMLPEPMLPIVESASIPVLQLPAVITSESIQTQISQIKEMIRLLQLLLDLQMQLEAQQS